MLNFIKRDVFRIFFILSILLNTISITYGQDTVNIKINLTNIDAEDMVIHFNDGVVIDVISFEKSDSILTVQKPFYTIYARISFDYKGKSNSFYVDDKPALIHLHYDESRIHTPFYYDNNTNLIPIYDTASNEVYHELQKIQYEELQKLNDLFVNHGHEIRINDSVKYELAHTIKKINQKSLLFLKCYSDNFLSFYYFVDQVLARSSYIDKDSDYFSMLLSYMNDTFPDRYLSTEEGERIVASLQQKISPIILNINSIFPDITLRDISGNKIKLRNFEEEYILLDFWASWCAPCLNQLPDLKNIRNQFTRDQIKVVSISSDRDSTKFINSVKENNMDWTHVWDKKRTLGHSIGISAIPTILLIDKSGKILYYNTGGKIDTERLKEIIVTTIEEEELSMIYHPVTKDLRQKRAQNPPLIWNNQAIWSERMASLNNFN